MRKAHSRRKGAPARTGKALKGRVEGRSGWGIRVPFRFSQKASHLSPQVGSLANSMEVEVDPRAPSRPKALQAQRIQGARTSAETATTRAYSRSLSAGAPPLRRIPAV